MKVSIALSTILAGLAAANVMHFHVSQDDIDLYACCNRTPCFIGCWVNGEWRVGSCFLANEEAACCQNANTAGDSSIVVKASSQGSYTVEGCFSRCMEFSLEFKLGRLKAG